MKFDAPLGFVIGAVQQAWTAYKFQIHADDDDPAGFFRTAVTYYVAGISYLWLGVAIWGPEMVRLLTHADFHPAAQLVEVVALINVAQGLYFMMGTGLELSDNTARRSSRQFLRPGNRHRIVVRADSPTARLGCGDGHDVRLARHGWRVVLLSAERYPIHYDWPALGTMAVLAAACGVTAFFGQSLPWGSRLALAIALSIIYPLLLIVVLLRSPTERHRMHILWARLGALWSKSRSADSDSEPVKCRSAE